MAALVTATLLAGCAGAPTTAPAPPRPTAEPPVSAPAALVAERQWLQSWFAGTPVRIVQQGDGTVSVDVPREHCFEPGRSAVKPALAAVLDKVAESLRRLPHGQLALLAAPEDAAATPALAQQRAGQLQKALLQRGVRGVQIGHPSVTAAAAVQLRLVVVPR